ncbi:MarR family winged helix-turn-helix transcriptional regulator [Microbacterium gorillae]|uniref:MarR family winged helix-turn-helix transcriptional regulator n=1 Tax=Microbacterium gorillae TaxID=1231063 RepID=UPI000590CB1E|nr:MarR family winged helix-turn-helix transcriptional regulator [Microbacterium gorillae]
MAPDTELDPYRHTGYLIRRAQQLHVATWTRVVSTETSSVQYAIMAVLHRVGDASQRELCDAVDLDRSTIADLIARMERRGLVARHRDPADRRRNTVTLTDAGQTEYAMLQPRVTTADAELTSILDPTDREALRQALRELLAAT